MATETHQKTADASVSDVAPSPVNARYQDCPCTADHCRTCGGLNWTIDRICDGEPQFRCRSCGSPQGAEK